MDVPADTLVLAIPTMKQFTIIAETRDSDGCPAQILFDPKWEEWWWRVGDEMEGPFSSRHEAEADLASR